jgi:hypothetical protein
MRTQLESRAPFVLGAVVLAATVVRLGFGFVWFGFHTGDDVEILQAGFERALGWPYQAWDIRNLLVPDLLVAPVLAFAAGLGVRSTQTLAWLATFPFVLLASVNIWLVYRLVRQWLANEMPALLAAGLYAFHWLPLGYGSTVYPRTSSTTCVLLAALLLGKGRTAAWRAALAGGLIALAWAIRYSEIIFLLPLLASLWLREERTADRVRSSALLLLGFAAGSLLTVGLEDWLTWGRPFASLAAFARYTLVERRASALEPSQPWYWYLYRLPKWLPLPLLPFLWRARKVPGSLTPALYVLLPLLALSAIHHKQLRYLQGIIPFLLILAAAGAWSYWVIGTVGRRRLVAVLVVLSLLAGLTGLTFLRKKSMAAVVAAQDLAATSQQHAICLSQAWAYGGSLYLRNAVLRDLPYPLSGEMILREATHCPVVALYQEDVQRDPGLPAALDQLGYMPSDTYRWGQSKPVLVFHRPDQDAP